MLHYLYKGTYSDGSILPTPQTDTEINADRSPPTKKLTPFISSCYALVTNAEVYALAEKYDIPSLKCLATKKYGDCLPQEWNSESFVTSLSIIYTQTPESDTLLKDVALQYALSKVRWLSERGDFVSVSFSTSLKPSV